MQNNLGNYIVYKVMIDNLVFDETINIESIYENVIGICLEQIKEESPRMTIFKIMLCNNIDNNDIAKEIGNVVMDDVLNKLAFDNFIITGCCELKSIKTKFKTTSNIDCPAEIIVRSGESQLKQLKQRMESIEEYPKNYYRMYRMAIKDTDVVAKYMFLYSILASLVPNPDNKEQKNVDQFIKNELEKKGISIEERKSTKWNFNTTVITWLRNEVGHTKEGSDIDKVKREMDIYIDKLSELVRIAITKYS